MLEILANVRCWLANNLLGNRRKMDRREKLLSGPDVNLLTELEIGALRRPFLNNRSEGAVTYANHADTETLRRKYKDDRDADLNKLVDVDVVWGKQTFKRRIEPKKCIVR